MEEATRLGNSFQKHKFFSNFILITPLIDQLAEPIDRAWEIHWLNVITTEPDSL